MLNRLISRRNAIGGTVAVVAAAAATSLWRLHQSLPPRDPAAEERFCGAQDALLAESGTRIRSHFVELANPKMRAQVLEGGEGDPLVLIHGGDGFAAQLEPLLSRLSNGFHVCAPDRPGCGLSDMFDYRGVPLREHAVDFIESTLNALGLKRVALVGNSMGGYFSLVFALAHPERVSRLITIGEPAGSSAKVRVSHRLMATRGINGLMYSTIMKPGDRATLEGFKRVLVVHPERISKAYMDCCTTASLIPGATESWLTMLEDVVPMSGAATLTYALRPELHKLTMPTLLIWGEKDTFGPPSEGVEMAAMMPHGTAVTLADAGHLVWLDQPEHTEGLIRHFLNA